MSEIIVTEGYRRVEGSDVIIGSGGAEWCGVLGGIYDKRISYIIHDFHTAFGEFFGEMAEDLNRDVEDKEKLVLYVGGLARIKGNSEEEVILRREKILEGIHDVGYANRVVKVQWCKPCYGQELTLIASEGRGYFEEEMIED